MESHFIKDFPTTPLPKNAKPFTNKSANYTFSKYLKCLHNPCTHTLLANPKLIYERIVLNVALMTHLFREPWQVKRYTINNTPCTYVF